MAVLWKDRKRICVLPITFTKYRLEGERLYVTKGLLRTVEDETLLYRVLDISLERTLADKIFGVGTIVLHCADQTHPQLRLENVRHSENVRAMLSEKIEEERSRARVAGREMYGAANSDLDSLEEFDAPAVSLVKRNAPKKRTHISAGSCVSAPI